MKNLLFKELRLAAHPTLFVFTALGVLVIVPNYPYSAIFLFGCLATYITAQYGRETNDAYYTALLPVDRRSAAKAKILLSVIAEIAQLIISLPFAFIRPLLLPSGNVVGIEANVAFYGFALLAYAVYNLIFFSLFYKTAYKAGKSFILAFMPVLVIILFMESAVHFPGMLWLDSVTSHELLFQLPIFALGALAFILCNAVAVRIAGKRFARVDV